MAKNSAKKARKEPSKFSVQIKQLTADTKEITDDPTTKIFGSLLVVMIGFFAGIAILSFTKIGHKTSVCPQLQMEHSPIQAM